jgi:hypothetical protein
MADEVVLQLTNLTKTYILGRRKNAVKAQEAIHKLQKQHENMVAKGSDKAKIEESGNILPAINTKKVTKQLLARL